jgi:hypothetical protein
VKNKREVYTSDSFRVLSVLGTSTLFAEIYYGKRGHSGMINEDGKVIITPGRNAFSIEFPEQECPLFRIGSITKPIWLDCNGDTTTYDTYLKKNNMGDRMQAWGIKEVFEEASIHSSSVYEPKIPEGSRIVNTMRVDGEVVSYIVNKNGMYGLVSANGDILMPFEHRQLSNESDYVTCISDGYRGLYSAYGKEILKPVFTGILFSREYHGYFHVFTTDGYCGFASPHGRVFLPQEARRE